MASDTDLTVVVPVRDAAATIEDLTHLLAEVDGLGTHLVLVDDGSRDGTSQVLRRMAGLIPNVDALFHEASRGAGVARNHGFEHARRRYTLFFDADDHPHVQTIRRAVELLDESQADVAVMPYDFHGDGAQVSRGMMPPTPRFGATRHVSPLIGSRT